MKILNPFLPLCLGVFLALQATTAQSQSKIWFDKPATYYEESLVLGNGKLGASVFGGVESDQIYLNEAVEPAIVGNKVIDLLNGGTMDAWTLPSNHWRLHEGVIIGDTGGEVLDMPEWIYTKQQFSDFEFTCEMKLTGDKGRNTGVYFRVKPFLFTEKNGNKSYEAASGYEFDAAFHNPGKTNFRGSLGDWYARPSLRVFPDEKIINEVYKSEDWNRLTIRARGNRLEYWINGIKIMDFKDDDPKGSRKGIIGFQIHNGSVMKIAYRNIRVLPLN